MSYSHMAQSYPAGTWHMVRVLGKSGFPVQTQCGLTLKTGKYLQEAPAFCRPGGKDNRCKRCKI